MLTENKTKQGEKDLNPGSNPGYKLRWARFKIETLSKKNRELNHVVKKNNKYKRELSKLKLQEEIRSILFNLPNNKQNKFFEKKIVWPLFQSLIKARKENPGAFQGKTLREQLKIIIQKNQEEKENAARQY